MTSTTKIIGAADAQRMLDDGRWEYDDSAADCARSVIDLHRQVDTARSVAANIERERSALREAYYRDTAGLRAEVRVIVDERAAWRDRVEARDEVAERLTAELSTATGEVERLRARLAETPTAEEVDYLDALLARQHAILTGVADALRGDPGPHASHSHHDLAERAAAMVAVLAVTQASLEAASSGRRVTACDEIERLQRELAEARAALREYVPRCTDCDALATRQLDGYAGWGGLRCDACAPVASQHAVEHAAALRAATVTP